MAGLDFYRIDLKIVELTIPGLDFCPKLRLGWSCSKFTTYTHWRHVQDGTLSWNTPLMQHSDSPIKDSHLILYQKLNNVERPVGMQKVSNGLMTAIFGTQDQKVNFKCELEEMKKYACEVSAWIRCTKTYRNPELSAISNEYSRSYRAGDMEMSVNTVSTSVTAAESVDLSLDLTGDLPKVFFPIVKLEEVYYHLLIDNLTMSPKKEAFIDMVKTISCIPADVNQFELSQEDIDQVPHVVRMFVFMEMQRQMDGASDGSGIQRWNIAQCDIVGLQTAVYRFLQSIED